MQEQLKHFNQQQVEFMDACGQLRLRFCDAIDLMYSRDVLSAVSLWNGLIDEEVNRELRNDLIDKFFSSYRTESVSERIETLTAISDHIADSIYVLCGLANLLGIPIHQVFAEVHRSNMSKAVPNGNGGFTVIKREDGKILKPAHWTPPNIKLILATEYDKHKPKAGPLRHQLKPTDAPGN